MAEPSAKHETIKHIEWNEIYSVGNKFIDDQHKILIGLINTLIKFRDQNDKFLLKKVLNTLVAYTEKHFKFEERLMSEAKYPEIEDHIGQHRQFAKQIHEFSDQFNLNQTDLDNEVLTFLHQWLTTHILIHDKDYEEHIKKANLENFSEGASEELEA